MKITVAVTPQVSNKLLSFYLHNPSWHSMKKNSEHFKAFVRGPKQQDHIYCQKRITVFYFQHITVKISFIKN